MSNSKNVVVSFNNKAILLNASASRHYPVPANKPSTFTYEELNKIYTIIKPFRSPNKIAFVREDLLTYHDSGKPTRKLTGTIQAMRGDASQSLVFVVSKEVEPGKPAFYRGSVFGPTYAQRLDFETWNFSDVENTIKSHMLGRQLQGIPTFPSLSRGPQG